MKTNKPPTPGRVSRTQLSRLLAYSRTTICRHLAKPDAPRADRHGLYDQAAALAFLRGVITKAGRPSTEMEKLRLRRLAAEVEVAELALKRSRGEVIDVAAVVIPALRETISQFQEGMRAKFEQELPPRYTGKTWVECQAMNAEAVDLLVHNFKAGAAKIAQLGAPAQPNTKAYGA